MTHAKKCICLNIPVDRFDRLKETAGRLSMTMTALLNRLVLDYLDSDAATEEQAEQLTEIESKIVTLTGALNDLQRRAAMIRNHVQPL